MEGKSRSWSGKVRKLVKKIEATTSRNSKNRNGTSQGKVNNIGEMFRRMEGLEKRTLKMTEGWRKEDGGGGKRKRMGEDSSEIGLGNSDKYRKCEKGEKGVQCNQKGLEKNLED